jgi:hypothetical protein
LTELLFIAAALLLTAALSISTNRTRVILASYYAVFGAAAEVFGAVFVITGT